MLSQDEESRKQLEANAQLPEMANSKVKVFLADPYVLPRFDINETGLDSAKHNCSTKYAIKASTHAPDTYT